MDTFLTLKQLQAVLKENNISPRKELGQNFLIDRNMRNKILSFAEITGKDTVVEIGAGLGALTGAIAEKAGFVYAFEKDNKLAGILKNRLECNNRIKIIEKDFLDLDQDFFCSAGKIKIIGNLPYYVASPILFRLLKFRKYWNMAIVMIPEDVAIRIVAKTGDKNFGLMAVLFSMLTGCSICCRVPGSVFYPEPEIRSVVMKIAPESKFETEIKDKEIFWTVLPGLFAQRRKNILNVLSRSFRIEKKQALLILRKAQIEPDLRSHQLKIHNIIKLVEQILETKSRSELIQFDHLKEKSKII